MNPDDVQSIIDEIESYGDYERAYGKNSQGGYGTRAEEFNRRATEQLIRIRELLTTSH